MGQFGRIAIESIRIIHSERINPIDAWYKSGENLGCKKSIIKKSCPKNAFLSLCEEGLVKGIEKGKYRKTDGYSKAKEYILKGMDFIIYNKDKSNICSDHNGLWKEVISGRSHQGEFDVLCTLYKKGLLNL